MTDQKPADESGEDKERREQRVMWIFSGAIALLILGAMGANMMFHHDRAANPSDTDVSAQSRPAPAQ